MGWYFYYVRSNPDVVREGAIYHLFARLGARQYAGLDGELRTILKEKGMADETSFEHLVMQSAVLDVDAGTDYEETVRLASVLLAQRLPISQEPLASGFMEGSRYGSRRSRAGPHSRTSVWPR